MPNPMMDWKGSEDDPELEGLKEIAFGCLAIIGVFIVLPFVIYFFTR